MLFLYAIQLTALFLSSADERILATIMSGASAPFLEVNFCDPLCAITLLKSMFLPWYESPPRKADEADQDIDPETKLQHYRLFTGYEIRNDSIQRLRGRPHALPLHVLSYQILYIREHSISQYSSTASCTRLRWDRRPDSLPPGRSRSVLSLFFVAAVVPAVSGVFPVRQRPVTSFDGAGTPCGNACCRPHVEVVRYEAFIAYLTKEIGGGGSLADGTLIECLIKYRVWSPRARAYLQFDVQIHGAFASLKPRGPPSVRFLGKLLPVYCWLCFLCDCHGEARAKARALLVHLKETSGIDETATSATLRFQIRALEYLIENLSSAPPPGWGYTCQSIVRCVCETIRLVGSVCMP
ncbi:hypothetical protein Q5P01_010557 [Channa striata]|uniref:Uncharacterized protein n=1 Tax=Channa striata TaxID=64152 RepID=A0AA88MXR8_CHASR|nr:hypothetical protein Q5P01_010557 [Channa striata]